MTYDADVTRLGVMGHGAKVGDPEWYAWRCGADMVIAERHGAVSHDAELLTRCCTRPNKEERRMETCDLCARAPMERERRGARRPFASRFPWKRERESRRHRSHVTTRVCMRESMRHEQRKLHYTRTLPHTLKFSTACTRLFYFPKTCSEKTKRVLASDKWDQEGQDFLVFVKISYVPLKLERSEYYLLLRVERAR